MKNKKITIYELIKITRDKEENIPYIVQYDNSTYQYDRTIGDYRKDGWGECLFLKKIFVFDNYKHNSFHNMLSDVVEILDETDDEFEEIEIFDDIDKSKEKEIFGITGEGLNYIKDKINQLIRNQKKIIEKVNKLENYKNTNLECQLNTDELLKKSIDTTKKLEGIINNK